MIKKGRQKLITVVKIRIYKWSKTLGSKIGLDLPYFIKNGFWVMFRQVMGIVSGLVLSIVFARLAIQEVFGEYQLVLSILSFASIFSIPGLNIALVRSVARGYEGDYKKVVKTRLVWSLVGVPVLLTVAMYYYLYQNQSLGIALLISALFFPLLYALNTWDSFLQGKSRFDVSAKYSSFQMIVNMIVMLGAVFFWKNNLILIIAFYLLSYVFFNIYYFKKSLKYITSNKFSRDVLSYGWFLTKINFFGLIAANIDKLLVGVLLGPSELAVYTIISVVPIKLGELFKSFVLVFLPKLSRRKQNINNIVTRERVIYLGSLLIFFTIIYCLSIDYVDRILFGKKYLEFYSYSRIYAIFVFLYLPLNFLGRYFQAKKNKKSLVLVNIYYYLIRIVTSIFCIYYFGLIGAVVAFNLNVVIWFILHILGLKKDDKIVS